MFQWLREKRLQGVVVCIFLLITGCDRAIPPQNTPTPKTIVVQPASPSLALPSESLNLEELGATITSTVSPMVTQTETPTWTPRPTSTPTWTALPTFKVYESEETIRYLLETNGGCQLPCWWGMTPGQTQWVATRQFLEQFVTIKEGPSKDGLEGGIRYHIENYSFEYSIDNHVGGASINIRNGVVSTIVVGPTENEYRIERISDGYAEYGKPTMYLATFSTSPDGYLPFELLLWFSERGVLAYYRTSGEIMNGEIIKGCFQDVDPWLYLMSPDDPLSYDDMVRWVLGPDPVSKPRLLQDVTEIDLEKYFKSDSDKCIETAIQYWP